MKIIIEGSTLFTKGYTGIPHYIISLQRALKKVDGVEVILGFNVRKKRKQKNLNPEVKKIEHQWYFKNIFFSLAKNPIISHSLHTPFLKIRNTKKIATIHDLAVHLPEFEHLDFATPYFKNKRFKLFKDIAKNADAIIAVSENTKQDFLKFFDFPKDKIHVVPLAPVFKPLEIDNKFEKHILQKYQLVKKKYYLTVGGVSVRKNSINLLKGFIETNNKEDKLVFAGKIAGNIQEEFQSIINNNNFQDQIISTNYIKDIELSVLYKNAKSFLFPTCYEGFGIPIIEAMSYRLPILTSTTGAAPEVAKGHAVLVNPFEPKEIAEGICKLANITDEKLSKAKKYADSFTWENVANNTIKVYQKVIEQ